MPRLSWSRQLFIADRVLNQCNDSRDSADLFIINWTYIDRFDYIIDNGLSPGGDSRELVIQGTPWHTCRPGDNSDYYLKYHSEYKDKLASLQLVKLCIDTLLQQKIRFIMTAIDELMFDRSWHMSAAIELLQNYTLPYITKFNNQSFLEYVDGLGHVRTSSGHVNEYAHRDAAQCITNSLDIQNIIYC